MNVWIIGPELLLDEWRALPIDKDLQTWYSNQAGEQEVPTQADAILYLFPDASADDLKWLADLPATICIINAVIPTTAELGEKFIRINGWPGFLGRSVAELAAGAITDKEAVNQLIKRMGRRAEWVPDTSGMLTPRVVAGIINEAYFAIENGVSTADEIDTAMKLGTNHPYGPVEWGKKIGLPEICHLLERLAVNQPYYSPSELLKKTALA